MSDGNGSSRRRTLLTHWAPLAVTLTVATVGVAAWAWYQRSEDDEDDHDGLDYGSGPGAADAPTSRSAPGAPGAAGGDDAGPSWGARVAERLRRTPSPQQVLGSAGKTVAAGVAAFGTALSSIREEDKAAFADHETWSEEADKLDRGGSAGIEGRERRGVAVVVSADLSGGEEGEEGLHAVSEPFPRARFNWGGGWSTRRVSLMSAGTEHPVAYPQERGLFDDEAVYPHLRAWSEGGRPGR